MDDQIRVPADAQVPPASPEQPSAPERITVVDVHFRSGGKVYFFDPGKLELKTGDHVIIDTSRGVEYGICASGCHRVPAREVVQPLRRVLRLATAQDEQTVRDNRQKEARAYDVCLKRIEALGLDMQLVSAECAFDGSKILFFFTADGRVDFRELVKSLASVFRTRIELRQIGVRDEAKMVGGLGVCGRPFCCTEFLDDFQPVSIKMAKVQNLSLNPTKISGTCGRLMCCLKYEQAAYEDLLRTSPKNESLVDTPDGRGTVTEVNLLRQSVKVRMEDHPEEINSYLNSEIYVLRSGKARKNDPPIPKDFAPISSNKAARAAHAARLAKEAEPVFLEPVIIHSMEEIPAEPAPQKPPRRRRRKRPADRPEQSAAPAETAAPAPEPKQEGAPRPPRRRKPRAPQPDGAPQTKPERTADAAPAEGAAPKPRRRRRRRPSGQSRPEGQQGE